MDMIRSAIDPESLKYDENGLIPAVVQDFESNRVLTLAYMNRESLEITLREGLACFWSRSRREIWRKGDTSGNYQHVVRITADCDLDSLLVEVIKDGPACHLNTDSCFEDNIVLETEAAAKTSEFSIDSLYSLLLDRKAELPEGSYTTYLFEQGIEKILKKVGEESAEVIIAAMKHHKGETVYELADLCYHSLVLMASEGITPAEIIAELASRHTPKNSEN